MAPAIAGEALEEIDRFLVSIWPQKGVAWGQREAFRHFRFTVLGLWFTFIRYKSTH